MYTNIQVCVCVWDTSDLMPVVTQTQHIPDRVVCVSYVTLPVCHLVLLNLAEKNNQWGEESSLSHTQSLHLMKY